MSAAAEQPLTGGRPGAVVIVGAGPAGLATAACLRREGIRADLLDAGSFVGESWAQRYDSLRLHTARWFSGLPGLAVPRSYGMWVSRDDYVRYLQAYAEAMDLDPVFGTRVLAVEQGPAGWSLRTGTGESTASTVVLATGHSSVPHVPDWPGRADFEPPLLHSSAYRRPADLPGDRVLVVGAGNSATEIAADLAAAGRRVWLSVRTPPSIVPRSSAGLPSQLIGLAIRPLPGWVVNPLSRGLRRLTVPELSSYGLPAPREPYTQFSRTQTVPVLDHGFVDHVRQGRITVVPTVDRLAGDQAHLTDGSVLTIDGIVAGTGWTPVSATLLAGDEQQGRAGRSALAARGLHLVGADPALSGLLHEISRDARRVARLISAERRSLPG